jgi:hypothetical protein
MVFGVLKLGLIRCNQWRSQEFTSGWAQTQKFQEFEDLPIKLHLCKRFSKILGGPVPTQPLFWLRYWMQFYFNVIIVEFLPLKLAHNSIDYVFRDCVLKHNIFYE